jgi:trehalose/maltose transport system substrate-binding protein
MPVRRPVPGMRFRLIGYRLHVARVYGRSAFRSLGLIFILLSGCSRPAPKPVTLTLLDQEWTTKHFQDVRKQELEDFTRETGIVVKLLPCPESAWEQLALWRRMLASGATGADVYGIDVIWPALLSDSLIDLRPLLGQDLPAHFPAVLGSYTVDDKLVALPRSAGIGLLYYRTDLLRDYGYGEPPKTWDELGTMAAHIQSGERAKGKKDFWGFVWQGAASEALTCNALEWQAAEGGGRIIEADKTISVNNPHAIRAWERAARWVGSLSPRSVVAYKEWDALNTWVAGNAAFMRNWTVALVDSQAASSAVRDKFDVTLLPGGRAGRSGTLGGSGLAVSRFTAHRAEAVELVRHLCSRGAQLRRVESLFEIPALSDLYGSSEMQAVTPLAPLLEEAFRSGVVLRPANLAGTRYDEVSEAYSRAVHSVLTGEKGAPQAATDLETELVRMTGFKSSPPRR